MFIEEPYLQRSSPALKNSCLLAWTLLVSYLIYLRSLKMYCVTQFSHFLKMFPHNNKLALEKASTYKITY